ncbi:MAG: ABC transporter permease [Bacteroidota bacterium]
MRRPPILATKLLRWFCNPLLLEVVEGDLHENFQDDIDKKGLRYARRNYWWTVVRSIRPYLLRKSTYTMTNRIDLLKNYLKIALRNLGKDFGYTAINISGLAIGLACCFVIAAFVQFELSYEGFHEKKDKIYRFIPRANVDGELRMQYWTPSGFAHFFLEKFEEVEKVSRFTEWDESPLLKYEDKVLKRSPLSLADSAFLTIFSFDMVKGNPETALKDVGSIIISESVANATFGDEDPIGKTIQYDNQFDFEVTGVFKDVPVNSHLQFDYLIPFHTLGLYAQMFGRSPEEILENFDAWNYACYLYIPNTRNIEDLQHRMTMAIDEKMERRPGPNAIDDWLQPLGEIHFTKGIKADVPTGNLSYVYMFISIAVFILLIACFNFMNLATAKAVQRAKEVGMRKVLGAVRRQLIYQFLGETILLCIIATAMSFLLLELLLPLFNFIMGFELTIWSGENVVFILAMVGIGVFTGVLAGSYPAFYLSAFKPARVLKNESLRSNRSTLRRLLIVLQFGIATFLIVGTITVYRQMEFMKNSQLGFDKEHVIHFDPPTGIDSSYHVFKQNLLRYSDIKSVTISNGIPGQMNSHWNYEFPDLDGGKTANINTLIMDFDYPEVLGLELIEGRLLSAEYRTDTAEAYLINEAAAKEYMLSNPVGTPFRVRDGRHELGQIVGVVKDFHYKSLHTEVEPLVLWYEPNSVWKGAIRFTPGNISKKLAIVESEWKKLAPDHPFEYEFLDSSFDELYKAEENTSILFTSFSILAIVVACLGLLGLTAYMTQQRRKEIGIRKVMGATVSNVIMLLSKDFTKLVIVAFIIFVPISWYLASQWLESFAYKINLGFETFAIAGFLLLAFSGLTVSYKSLKAAIVNPAETLRDE